VPVVSVQAVVGADPKIPVLVFLDTAYDVVGDGCAVGRVELVNVEVVAVILVEAVFRTEPEITLAVLVGDEYGRL